MKRRIFYHVRVFRRGSRFFFMPIKREFGKDYPLHEGFPLWGCSTHEEAWHLIDKDIESYEGSIEAVTE